MNDLKLRIATADDAAELLAIYAPYVTETAVTFECDVPTAEEFTGRICHTLERYPYIVAEHEGVIVGYAYAGQFRVRAAYAWSVETSIYVRGDMKHRGVGRALYAELEKYLARQNITNLYAAIAVCDGEDPYLTRDSVKFHFNIGYHKAGEYRKCAYKFGRWYNLLVMEKKLSRHLEAEPQVISFPEISRE